ncbi:MAG: hypothetical protein EBR09_08375 [Proteobacteria bacterium]|nr:hypothetical protein [Pseudomonadota bacterium]
MNTIQVKFLSRILVLGICTLSVGLSTAQDAGDGSAPLTIPEPPAQLPSLTDPASPADSSASPAAATPPPAASEPPPSSAEEKPPTPAAGSPAPEPAQPQSPEAKPSKASPAGGSGKDNSKVKTTRKVLRQKKVSALEAMGTSLIFSADAGVVNAVPAGTLANYKAKSGIAVEAKALGSVLLDNIIIDAGLGWFFYSVKGTEPIFINGKKLVDEDENAITDEVAIKLTGTIIEASPSYRLGRSFFTGPSLQLRYPSDLGFNSQIQSNSLGIYLGLQAGFQLFDKDLNTRFVARGMMPVNYKEWAALHLLAGVQIGLPFAQPENLTIQESVVKTTEKRIVEYRKQVFRFKMTRDIVKLVLDNLIVFYPEPGYPTMTTEAQSFLIDLSQSLATNEGNWSLLQVDTVSKNHARVVRDAIVSAGVSDKKVKVGLVLAGDKTVANPPVEFTFKGVKNQSQLMDAVRRAMTQMSIPETCEGGVCQ